MTKNVAVVCPMSATFRRFVEKDLRLKLGTRTLHSHSLIQFLSGEEETKYYFVYSHRQMRGVRFDRVVYTCGYALVKDKDPELERVIRTNPGVTEEFTSCCDELTPVPR